MKMETNFVKTRNWLAISFLFGMTLASWAQQDGPQSPASGASGPSLEVTMKFIQNKLNGIGAISYTEFRRNTNIYGTWNLSFTNEISNVYTDQERCRISYHRKASDQIHTYKDEDKTFSLRDVQDVLVRPREQHQSEWLAKNGSPSVIVVYTSPPITEVELRHPHGEEDFFLFTDASLADRVARAFSYAIDLCGGGNKEPF